jgi:hypothetical protein
MRVDLDAPSARRVRRTGWLRGRVRLNRPGRVQLRVVLERVSGRPRAVRLGSRVVTFRRPGSRPFALRLGRAARLRVPLGTRRRAVVTGRFRSVAGRSYLRTARRRLRR